MPRPDEDNAHADNNNVIYANARMSEAVTKITLAAELRHRSLLLLEDEPHDETVLNKAKDCAIVGCRVPELRHQPGVLWPYTTYSCMPKIIQPNSLGSIFDQRSNTPAYRLKPILTK